MRLIIAVFCVIPACAFAQQDNPFLRGLEQGSKQAHERRLQQERLAAEAELQKQRLAAEADLEKQRLALEREKLAKMNGTSSGAGSAVAPVPDATPPVDPDMLAAINALSERYPDLKSHLPEMARIEKMYKTWDGLTKQMYIEGFYWVAKSASFSTMATREGTLAIGPAITNDDVIALVGAGLQEATIIVKIRSSPRNFRLGTADLLRLKSSNVPDAVMRVMLEAVKP